jgi:7-carboxy-7-deazaguanine synthase
LADRIRISEIFTSIQGEGMWCGVPSTFVRFSGCNLRCRWCDTPYASWNPEGDFYGVDDLVKEMRQAGQTHVVITGGEPMIFDALTDFAARLKEAGHVITIETAGTVFRNLPCDLMSISPKLANSDPDEDTPQGWHKRHRATRQNLEPLAQLTKTYPYQLKFVVDPEGPHDDLAEIDQMLSQLPGVDQSRVVLMSEGRDAETLARRNRLLSKVCLERGWRLTPRLQIDLFGDTRGT